MVAAQPCSDPVTEYAQAVSDGRIIAGPYVRQACKRHLDDLASGHLRGLRWSAETANYVIDFTRFIRHSKGEWRGKRLELAEWQKFVVGCAFGWLVKDDDGWRRRFRTLYEEVPKKNGKSTMCGFLGLYGLVGDGEPGSEVYAAATAKQQALIVFNEAKEMVKTSPELRTRIQVLMRNLSDEATFSKFEPIASDESTGDGINPHFGICDEIHRYKNRNLMTVISEGMGTRRQPMFIIITTSGDDKPDTPYDEEHNYALKVLSGAIVDDTYFAYIACPDEDDDPLAEATWAKANPSLGISVKIADMRARASKAGNSPAAMADFKRYRLNVRSSDSNAAIKMENWRKNSLGHPIDEASLYGRVCRTAVDLSSKSDITTIVHLFPPREEGERWIILPRFWVPAEGIIDRASKDRAPYQLWVEQGHLKTTPGNLVDYNAIFKQLEDDHANFAIADVAVDPWNAGSFMTDGMDAGMDIVKFDQNTRNYTGPTKEFLGMLPDAKFDHGDNPVLAWMASNLVLITDHNGNKMPSKKNTKSRIDGIAAAIMAMGRAMLNEDDEDRVTRGILVI